MTALSGDASTAGLSTGTMTFVFTDIEGSMQRWERNRVAMQDAVQRHDAIMRSAIARHHGRVFKTIGDAFRAAFTRAGHVGTADERGAEYFGPPVNRVARLFSIAHAEPRR